MKAIQIKVLPATNTKGTRLKAWTEAGSVVKSRNYAYNLDDQAHLLAKAYLVDKNWHGLVVRGFGQLPNGDYVATIGAV